MSVIAVTAGTSTNLAKLVEYALAEISEGIKSAADRGAQVLLPPYADFQVTMVSGGGLNAYDQNATEVRPEIITTQATTNPEITRTSTSTRGAQTNTTTPHGQQTALVRTGGDTTTTDYTHTTV